MEKVALPEALAEPIRKLLDEQALVVRDGDAEVMTVWFRTEIPAKATAEQVKNGLTYREIPEGCAGRRDPLPGEVHRLPQAGDSRGRVHAAVRGAAGHRRPHRHRPAPGVLPHVPGERDKTAEPMEKKKLIEVSSLVNEGPSPRRAAAVAEQRQGCGRESGEQGERRVRRDHQARRSRPRTQKTTLGFAITVAGVRKE